LAGIGLYGVLDYSVLQRRREIAIRMAVGASAGRIANTVVSRTFAMVACGAAFGAGLGLIAARYVGTLLYEVKPSDPDVLVRSLLAMVVITAIASIAPVARAVTIEPLAVLKVE
jgi:ABC-type antimicrobial peptide transport system permease subunit